MQQSRHGGGKQGTMLMDARGVDALQTRFGMIAEERCTIDGPANIRAAFVDAQVITTQAAKQCFDRTALRDTAMQQAVKEAWSSHLARPATQSTLMILASTAAPGPARLRIEWVSDTTKEEMRRHAQLRDSHFGRQNLSNALGPVPIVGLQGRLVDEPARTRQRQIRHDCAKVERSMVLARRDQDLSGKSDFKLSLEKRADKILRAAGREATTRHREKPVR